MTEPPPSALDLSLLDPRPGHGEAAYRELRDYIVRRLDWSGCTESEEIADEAIFRGLQRLARGVDVSAAGPRAFIWGVAKNVRKEAEKRHRRAPQLEAEQVEHVPAPAPATTPADARLMLERTFDVLTGRNRRILLQYLRDDDHDALCRWLEVSEGTLRVLVHRIRKGLKRKLRPDLLGRARAKIRRHRKKKKVHSLVPADETPGPRQP